MKNYVFISSDCIADTKQYDVENIVLKIKEALESQHYLSNFEVFQYPYFVKKNIARRYRLLVRLNTYTDEVHGDYRVYIFLKLYIRSDKEYENLFVNARTYGNLIYNRSDLVQEVESFVAQLNVKQPEISKSDKSLVPYYIRQCSSNFLDLLREKVDMQYLIEPRQWVYQVLPELIPSERQAVYSLLTGILSENNIHADHLYHFPDYIALFNGSSAQEIPLDQYLSRDIPLDSLFELDIWLEVQQLRLPLYLNELQRQVVQQFFKNHDSVPLCVDAASNTGKTSILAILMANMLACSNSIQYLNVFFILEVSEVDIVKEQLILYFKVIASLYGIQTDSVLIEHYIEQSCVDLTSLVLSIFPPQLLQQFASDLYIGQARFYTLWHQHDMQQRTGLSAYLCWHVIQHAIKGLYDEDDPHWLGQTTGRYQNIDISLLNTIYEKVWLSWYLPLCKNMGYWDDQDLVQKAFDHDLKLPEFTGLFVDNSEQYSPLSIAFLMQSCNSFRSDIYENIQQMPVVFLGNQEYSVFDWMQQISQQTYQYCNISPKVERYSVPQSHIQQLNVYFVNTKQSLDQLLAQSSAHWLKGGVSISGISALQKNSCLSSYFDFLLPQQFDFELYYLDQLPPKASDLVLLDFNLADIEIQRIVELSRLSINRIFIVSPFDDYDVWQQNLAKINVQLHIATDIKFNNDISSLLDIDVAQLTDSERCLEYAEQCETYHQHEKAWRLRCQSYALQQRYVDYFELAQSDVQKSYMVEKLWSEHLPQTLWRYREYVPQAYKYNICAIEQCFYDSGKVLMANCLLGILQCYLKQENYSAWSGFWQVLLPQILQRIQLLNSPSMVDQWGMVLATLDDMRKQSVAVSTAIYAICAYNAQKYSMAKGYWEQSVANKELKQLPDNYHYLTLSTTTDIQEHILAYIALKNTEKLMTILIEQDLNALQHSYWDKILAYLDDEGELKSVLKKLLVHIHSQELLDKLYRFCQNHTDGNFTLRIQRLKTLQACLHSDWDVVIDRIEHHVPTQQDQRQIANKLQIGFGDNCLSNQQLKNRKLNIGGKKKSSIELNVELVDILYALNLNTDLQVCLTAEEFETYAQNQHISTVFEKIKRIFTVEHQGIVAWHHQFPAIRALTGLLEKSPVLSDALELYKEILDRDIKDPLHKLCLERTAVVIERLKPLLDENSEYTDCIRKLELKYKKGLKVDSKTPLEPIHIKSEEDLIKSILELTQKEYADIQKLKKDEKAKEKQAQEVLDLAKQAEQKRLVDAEREKERKIAYESALQQKQQQEAAQIEEEKRLKAEKKAQAKQKLLAEKLAKDEEERLKVEQMKQDEKIAEALLLERNKIKAVASESISSQAVISPELSSVDTSSINSMVEVSDDAKVFEQAIAPTGGPVFTQKESSIYTATAELTVFGLRFFLSRMYKRFNIESLDSGMRWSIQIVTQQVSSDWQYTQTQRQYHIAALQLNIFIEESHIVIEQYAQGVTLNMHF